jgi:hypothetical protein
MFIFHKSILFIYYKQVFRKINTKNGSNGCFGKGCKG